MSQYIVKAAKTYLKTPLTTTATSVVLRKLQDSKGNNLTLADFGAYGVIVIKQGETIEMIKFNAISTAADDTATLTVASSGRNLDPTTPYAGYSTGNAFQSGAEVIVTNDPLTVSQFGNINNAQTWALLQTFTLAPVSSADASAANELVRKSQLDAAVLGTLTLTPVVVPANAGETLAVDQVVYLNTSDGEWYKADADTAGQVDNVILGITRGAGTDGNAITNGVTVWGAHEAASAIFTANTVYYASNTAGGFSASAGTTEVTLGFAHTTTKFYLIPRYNQLITENIQDALAGSEGTPSNTNKYVTETGLQKSSTVYAADAEASDTYVITLSPAPAAYTTGMVLHFKANTANTGAATLNVNSLGAITIKKHKDQDLATGDIESGQIITVVYDGTNFQMQSQLAQTARPDAQAQTFTSSGTWTKPTGATRVQVYVWGAGGGGGGGCRNTQAGGGGGGGGGAFIFKQYDAADLSATEQVTVGTGGTGGAGVANSTIGNGSAGTAGGNSSFSSGGNLITAGGGGAGGGGTNAAGGAAGSAGSANPATGTDTFTLYTLDGGAGGAGSATSDGSNAGSLTALPASGRGGGGGGGSNGTNTAAGTGGTNTKSTPIAALGFPQLYDGAQNPYITMLASAGGAGAGGHGAGGGGASGSGSAGTGIGAGGGGAGGQDSDNSTSGSGSGGAGTDGLVVVVTYF